MKERLLEYLVCPSCQGQLTLAAAARNGEDVVQGELLCDCSAVYPICGGIPRFVPSFSDKAMDGQEQVARVDFVLEADGFVAAVTRRLAIFLIRRRVGSTCDCETL